MRVDHGTGSLPFSVIHPWLRSWNMQVKTEQVQSLQVVTPAQRRSQHKQLRLGILFMAPAFLVIAVFMLGPALWAIYISFTNMSLTGAGAATPLWVGYKISCKFFTKGRSSTALECRLHNWFSQPLSARPWQGCPLAFLIVLGSPLFSRDLE